MMKKFKDESIDMCITSPPYYNLRDYDNANQLGREETVDKYIDNLINVFNEVQRVLKSDGSLFVNIDDVYYNKCLMCIPDMFKIKMIQQGWICRNEIIWHKPNAMPSSVKTRYNNDYEKIFFFTKQQDYYFKTQYEPFKSQISIKHNNNNKNNNDKYNDIIQESSVRQGMNKSRGSKVLELRKDLPPQDVFVNFLRSKTNVNFLSENIIDIKKTTIEHWFRRDKGGFAYPSVEDWNKIKIFIQDNSSEFQQIDFGMTNITYETDDIMKNIEHGRIKRAVWDINTKPLKQKHFASFPTELVESPIDATCRENGVVLDCFMGSGTVGIVANRQNKNFIGIELNEEYYNIAKDRIENEVNKC